MQEHDQYGDIHLIVRSGILCPLRQVDNVEFMEWSFLSAEELSAALRAGAVTSVELAEEAIARIEREDKGINAICVPDFDRARAAAERADEALARGEDRSLLGIPVTVKESYDMAGLPTTWGMPMYRDHVPTEDALQVSRLKAAGAVLLGKTNVPLVLRDIQSFNEIYGTTNNPWDHTRTSGGSSGGSAAALAAGFGALSIGSDLAGSLRTPRISAVSTRTSRRSGWRPPAAWSRRPHRRCRSTSISPWSVRWRAPPAISRCCST